MLFAVVAVMLGGRPAIHRQTTRSAPFSSTLKMSAWLVFDEGSALVDFRSHAASLDTVSAEWIVCGADGHATRNPKPTPGQKRALLAIARRNHVRVLALAANNAGGDFNAESVEKDLEDKSKMRAHAKELVDIAIADHLDGVDLDYESLRREDRDAFSAFVSILGNECHHNHLLLALALHPKTSEPGTWRGPQSEDYGALGRSADMVRIMTYDQHWSTSEAGPVASPEWVESVAQFAVIQIPAGKLDLGLPAYGYDWVGKKGKDISWFDFMGLARTFGAPRRGKASDELTIEYPDHTVYFPDGVAASRKFLIARKLGLHGLAMWRLGTEDPAVWNIFTGK